MTYSPGTFSSFQVIGEDAANSRVFANIHYQPSADSGLIKGRKVTANILDKLGYIKRNMSVLQRKEAVPD